jgi:hypothetical protein
VTRSSTRISWPTVVDRAREIVDEYDQRVTLRQLFYRLVVEGLPNKQSAYKRLSDLTAHGRRDGTFADLIDTTRWIHRPRSWASAEDALDWLRDEFRLDRTAGQPVSLYVGVEKRALVGLLGSWFDERGIPVLPLGGYSSQSFVGDVRADVDVQERRAVLLYSGDFDPSGEDIDRDFVRRTGCFDKVVRVALSAEQVDEYDLPPQPGKAEDSRAADFVRRYGRLVQVELDALPPETLRGLYEDAVRRYWDVSEFAATVAWERREREEL